MLKRVRIECEMEMQMQQRVHDVLSARVRRVQVGLGVLPALQHAERVLADNERDGEPRGDEQREALAFGALEPERRLVAARHLVQRLLHRALPFRFPFRLPVSGVSAALCCWRRRRRRWSCRRGRRRLEVAARADGAQQHVGGADGEIEHGTRVAQVLPVEAAHRRRARVEYVRRSAELVGALVQVGPAEHRVHEDVGVIRIAVHETCAKFRL